MDRLYRITAGDDASDIRGFTHHHIQAAVDRAALLGGGEVVLSAGVFEMGDSLHLRAGVLVKGQGGRTILRKQPMKQARIVTFLGFGHYDVVVDQPDQFEPGEGVILSDRNAVGFYQTVSTLIRRDGDAWIVSRPHAHDYHVRSDGVMRTLFPVVSAVDVADARVEDLVIDGLADRNDMLNGCRGGGFFAHRSSRVAARRLTVRNFNGEGFSFQTCDDLMLESCVAEECSGNGFHPGSGSNRFVIRGCTARRCGACGLFYCLRVRDSLLEDSLFEGNGSHGVSIGDRDTGHTNRNLTIRENGGAGVFLRPGGWDVAAHGNRIEGCRIERNAARDGEAEVVLQGEASGVVFAGNRVHRREGRPGLLVKPEMPAFEMRDNVIEPPGPEAVVDQREAGVAR